MYLKVRKSVLKGQAAMPASKSHTIRAVALAALANGKSVIRRPLISGDTLNAVNCYKALGAIFDTTKPDRWDVTGTAGKVAVADRTIDAGNSGTTLAFATGSAALADGHAAITLTGDEQTKKRPLAPLLKSLCQLGAKAESIEGNGCPPVSVMGKLTGGKSGCECFLFCLRNNLRTPSRTK